MSCHNRNTRWVLTTVVQHRMKAEYGVDTILEPLAGYNTARWAEGGWDAIDEATVCVRDHLTCSLEHAPPPYTRIEQTSQSQGNIGEN